MPRVRRGWWTCRKNRCSGGRLWRGGDSHCAGDLKAGAGDKIAKGNVLATARIAGIQAAKRTGDLIPMCHPLPLDHCEVDFDFPKAGNAIVITATARGGADGVEMEALTAVNLAALTIYDMCKAVDKKMRITNVKLVSKTKQ